MISYNYKVTLSDMLAAFNLYEPNFNNFLFQFYENRIALGWTGIAFKNQDAANTGAMSFHFGSEGGISIGYQQFTGSIIGGPKPGAGAYPQTSFQQSFNRANTFLQLGDVRTDFSTHPWMQNLLHDNVTGNPHFNHQNYNFNLFGISGVPY